MKMSIRVLNKEETTKARAPTLVHSLCPYSSYWKQMIENCTDNERASLPSVAFSDFTGTSLEFLVNPDSCAELSVVKTLCYNIRVEHCSPKRVTSIVSEFNKTEEWKTQGKKTANKHECVKVEIVPDTNEEEDRPEIWKNERVLEEVSETDGAVTETHTRDAETGTLNSEISTSATGIYLPNDIYLPLPYDNFWIRHGYCKMLKHEDFAIVFGDFPEDYKWLLLLGARTAEMTTKNLYEEILIVESILFYVTRKSKDSELPCPLKTISRYMKRW